MFKKVSVLVLMALHIALLNYAQVEEKYGSPNDVSLPNWVRLMYEESPDIGVVLDAFNAYYKDYPFVKNQHTQYLKRWLWRIQRYEYQFEDPTLDKESHKRLKELETNYLQKSKDLTLSHSSAANWYCVGPFDWDHDAASRSYAPGAAHVYTVEHCESNPDVIYAGTATAGIWKSTDRGLNWISLSDDLLVGTVYAIEVDHTNSNIVYASMFDNIYKTVDGGTTWSPTGDMSFQGLTFSTRDIRMHPSNQNILFAATDGGFFKTTDAGSSWTTIMSGSFQELEFHPTNPDIIYMVKVVSNRIEFYKSIDGGNAFTQQTTGWPTPALGDPNDEHSRGEIAVTPDNPSKVYVMLTGRVNGGAGLYGIYVSTDEGASWSFSCCGPQAGGLPDLGTTPPNINTMAWAKDGSDDGGQYGYDVAFAVSPTNEDSVFLGGVNMWVSSDGGATFVCPSKWSEPGLPDYVHADLHDIHYYPNGEIWVACDGGIFYSNDGGLNFTRRILGIAGSDLWGFGAGFWDWEVMLGGAYHNGTLLKNGNTYTNGWICTDGGDGTGGFVNYGNEEIVYSDYNIKTLPDDRTVTIPTRSYSQKPYTHYIIGRSSQIEFHPNYYTHYLFGREDGLWKSEDDNYTAFLIHDFGEPVADVEMSWADTNVIYVTTWPAYWDEKKVYKTTDGGQNWTEITPPTSLFSSRRYIEYDIELSYDDPNTLWLARVGRQTNDNNKIFKSTDGGASWINITGTALDGEVLRGVTLQRGTNEGLYIGTSRTVYYKNATLPDWQLYNTGLPVRTASRKIIINYRTEQLINPSNRSVWMSDLYETSTPSAEISVDTRYKGCSRDTFYFTDHSALSESGASWSWSFPGASYVSSTTSRTAKVVYGSPGTYDVSLTVADAYGTDSKAIVDMVEVDNLCEATETPGMALHTATNGDYVKVTGANLDNLTHFTTTAWIYPNGSQEGFAGIVSSGDWCAHCEDTEGLIFDYYASRLWYKWPGDGNPWASNSGMEVPLNQWSYVALVIEPTQATLYLNDQKYIHSRTLDPGTIENLHIGYGHYSKSFKGDIDEVTLWDRALSEAEIRELRHLTKADLLATDPKLIAYYQFTDLVQASQIMDNGRIMHGNINNGAGLTTSTVPVGGGTSHRLTVSSSPLTYDFTDAGAKLYFSDCSPPDGEMVVSRLELSPNDPANANADPGNYWVLNYYGNSSNMFSYLDSIELQGVDQVFIDGLDNPEDALFYTQDENEGGNNWQTKSRGYKLINNNTLRFRQSNYIESSAQISLTDGGAYFSEVIPQNNCVPDSIPGSALHCIASGDYAQIPDMGLTSVEELTITAWIKPDGTQSDYAGIVMNDGTAGGPNFREGNNTLGYHWNGGWSWDSNLELPAGEWSHIAFVVEPTGVTLYLNGIGEKDIRSPGMIDLTTMKIGSYQGWGSRNFNGLIDEVTIWTRPLTQNEIREMMHLTQEDMISDPNLISYVQFNEAGGDTYDKSGNGKHTAFIGNATRATSTAPIGGGTSHRQDISVEGEYSFGDTGLKLDFPPAGTYPDGELVAYRINVPPDENPGDGNILPQGYWIVRNYGLNNTFTELESIVFESISPLYTTDENDPQLYTLYKRGSNAFGSSWASQDVADMIQATTNGNGTMTFNTANGITSFSQFAISDTRGISLSAKVFLEGAYDNGSGLMGDALRSHYHLPDTEPYTALGYTHRNGGGGESCNATIFNVTGNDAIVDWVIIELRDKNDPTTILYTRSALLQRDGDVVDMDGSSAVLLTQVKEDDYYVAIRHRNHLGIRTPIALTFSGSTTVYDFTTAQGQAYGTNPMASLNGVFGMYAGDANMDGQVNAVDKNTYWRVQNGQPFNYDDSSADFNMDTAINAVDKNNYWRLNNSIIEQL